jgi:hypothetical protein
MSKRNRAKVPPKRILIGKHHPARPDKERIETLQTVLRLLVGGVLEGADELNRRLKAAQAELEVETAATTTIDRDETELDRLRYAIIATLVQTPELVQQGVSTANRVSRKATGFLSKVASPIASSWVMRPVRRRYERFVARSEARVERLLDQGRAEELSSRALVRRTTANGIDELLDYLAQKPEIRALVQQQSLGMAEEMMGELRDRSATADALAERTARAILRRPQREGLPEEEAASPAETK